MAESYCCTPHRQPAFVILLLHVVAPPRAGWAGMVTNEPRHGPDFWNPKMVSTQNQPPNLFPDKNFPTNFPLPIILALGRSANRTCPARTNQQPTPSFLTMSILVRTHVSSASQPTPNARTFIDSTEV